MLYVCAHFGAFVMGSDIDGRHMRGKNGKSIRKAAEQYGVEPLLMDLATFDLAVRSYRGGNESDSRKANPWRTDGFLDAIVTDPPYGVRAGAKRLGRKDPAKLMTEPYRMADGSLAHE
jgi:tRNA (guanine10-N2)-methyltransferase